MVAGRKRFRGRIAEVGDDGVAIERDAASYGDEPRVAIPFDAMDEARLVLTDDLIRDALKKDKKLRQEAKRHARTAADEGGRKTTQDEI